MDFLAIDVCMLVFQFWRSHQAEVEHGNRLRNESLSADGELVSSPLGLASGDTTARKC